MARLAGSLFFSILMGIASAASADALDPGSTLCLRPVAIPVEDEADPRRAAVESRLEDALREASFEVVDAQTVSAVLERERMAHAPRYDPITGEIDPDAREAFEAGVREALEDELGCDGLLHAHVTLVRASFNSFLATWDGKMEQVASAGRLVLNALIGVQESGWVAALSLRIRVSDLEDEELAYRAAGIESLASLSVTHGKDVLPADVWLTDEEKIEEAIESALGAGGRALREQGTPEGAD